MTKRSKRCRDCAFFSLACEGLDSDRCRFFDRELSRKETVLSTSCPKYIVREDERDVEFYIPERAEHKADYENEIKKYSIYMVLLVMLGIGFFYMVTIIA